MSDPYGVDRLNTWYYTDAEQSKQPVLAPARRLAGFEEMVGGLDTDTALLEARQRNFQAILELYQAQTEAALPIEVPPGLERAHTLWQTTLDYGMAYYEFELHWNQEMLKRVKKLPPLVRCPIKPKDKIERTK